MKILIADDEPKIRNGLRKFIVKNFIDCIEVETARDGLEALAICKKFSPDIILTDIRMPKLNGLDFISKVLEKDRDIAVIIISGYNDFKYAQEAIRLKVYDFLLKPIDVNQAKEVIYRAYNEIIEKRELKSFNILAKQCVDNCFDVIMSNIFQRIIKGDMDEVEYLSQQKFIGRGLPHGKTTIIGVRIIDNKKQLQTSRLEVILDGVKNTLSGICRDFENEITFVYQDYVVLSVFQSESTIEYCNINKEIKEYLKNNFECDAIIEHLDMDDLVKDLQGAIKLMWNRLFDISNYSSLINKIKRYLDYSYSNVELSLQYVANEFNVNASYLSRIFHKEVGISFGEYLTNLRLDHAVKLIESSERDIKIYEISNRVGYSSQHYFSRVFKKRFGVSPVDYKKKGDRECKKLCVNGNNYK